MTTQNTRLTCPDCGGSLEKIRDGNLLQYRCRVGHLYSPHTALAVHADREENTLWSAVVILQEGADMADEVAETENAEQAEELRDVAAAKRSLAARIEEVVKTFSGISLGRMKK